MGKEKLSQYAEEVGRRRWTIYGDGLSSTLMQVNPELVGNKEAVLRDLKERYVKVQPNVEMFWWKWRNISINLPAVGKFKWFKFECFISDGSMRKEFFDRSLSYDEIGCCSFGTKEKDAHLFSDKSYSVKEILDFFKAIKEYMKEYWIDIDRDVDYENIDYEKLWTIKWLSFEAWGIIWKILEAKRSCWMRDNYIDGNHVRWWVSFGHGDSLLPRKWYFWFTDNPYVGWGLLFKLAK